jgi:hypothetical protein
MKRKSGAKPGFYEIRSRMGGLHDAASAAEFPRRGDQSDAAAEEKH